MSPEPQTVVEAPPGILPWALSQLGYAASGAQPQLTPVAGDASSRRYFRLALRGARHILVHAPPATEKNAAFLAVRETLAAAGVRVPGLEAADLERGFLLLEDLGDRLLLSELSEATADACYQWAFEDLYRLAGIDCNGLDWPAYDRPLLAEELGRFPEWFVGALLGHAPGPAELALVEALCERLTASALEQPRVAVHRDFHSRNLMPQPDGRLGVIDFQDAVCGPLTYDLVSLLRDCYIRWPGDRVRQWAMQYRSGLLARGLLGDCTPEQFWRWFEWMGLQRHLKVLGTFARLSLRDGKAAYLEDLPLVLAYVGRVLARYAPEDPVFADFERWFAAELSPRIGQQPWSAGR